MLAIERMKILIVHDDPLLRESLQINLRILGHEILVAESTRQALQMIKFSNLEEEVIGLLITEMKMPDMDGLELIRSAREMAPKLPAILITADCNNNIERELGRLARCGHIEKPFGSSILLQTIARVINEQMG